MPGGDRTGPLGQGPMSGRGAGWCSGAGGPGYASAWGWRGGGMGFGGARGWYGAGGRGAWGRGGGRGLRNWFHATGMPGWARWGGAAAVPRFDSPATEQQQLTWQAEALERELQAIRSRLAGLAGSKDSE